MRRIECSRCFTAAYCAGIRELYAQGWQLVERGRPMRYRCDRCVAHAELQGLMPQLLLWRPSLAARAWIVLRKGPTDGYVVAEYVRAVPTQDGGAWLLAKTPGDPKWLHRPPEGIFATRTAALVGVERLRAVDAMAGDRD